MFWDNGGGAAHLPPPIPNKIHTMKVDLLKKWSNSFESIKQTNKDGIDYWAASDLKELLGYVNYNYFKKVIDKAKTACKGSGEAVESHFKNVSTGNAPNTKEDILMSRYACYLAIQNADRKIKKVAFANYYILHKARQYEILKQIHDKSNNNDNQLSKVEQSGKAFAQSITDFNVEKKRITDKDKVDSEHLKNLQVIDELLVKKNIKSIGLFSNNKK